MGHERALLVAGEQCRPDPRPLMTKR
jgi:hypothetical protein